MPDDSVKKYGVDIAVRRADDLDRRALAWVQQEAQKDTVPNVLDLGCGACGMSVRLANAGACVIGIDVAGYQEEFVSLRTQHSLSLEQLRFIQADMREALHSIGAIKMDMCVMQRVVHYLPHEDAVKVLSELKGVGFKRLFVSVTGIESDIGRAYADADVCVENRFCTLQPKDAEVFSMSQPLCLYTPEEFVVLLQEVGWEIEECWVSAFGNVKAVCF